MIQDLVCGMDITSIYGCEASEFNGIKYYFCCRDCKREFDKTPLKFSDKE